MWKPYMVRPGPKRKMNEKGSDGSSRADNWSYRLDFSMRVFFIFKHLFLCFNREQKKTLNKKQPNFFIFCLLTYRCSSNLRSYQLVVRVGVPEKDARQISRTSALLALQRPSCESACCLRRVRITTLSRCVHAATTLQTQMTVKTQIMLRWCMLYAAHVSSGPSYI